MAKASALLGGNYIKKDDLKLSGPERLVIDAIDIAEFDPKPGEKAKKQWELTFTDGRKLTLNVGNTQVLIAAYGDDTDLWLGNPIVAFFDPSVMFAGKRTGGVKIKIPSAAAKPAAAGNTVEADPFA